ncbi:MAG: MMPL family transporter, partial [Streptosporangiaceae bacterium]
AVTDGIARSAGVVTSAAVIMVAVFSIFATLSLIEFKMFGVAMAVAVLIDATIVRGVLLPAGLALLGERAWPQRARGPRGHRRARHAEVAQAAAAPVTSEVPGMSTIR